MLIFEENVKGFNGWKRETLLSLGKVISCTAKRYPSDKGGYYARLYVQLVKDGKIVSVKSISANGELKYGIAISEWCIDDLEYDKEGRCKVDPTIVIHKTRESDGLERVEFI